MKYGTNSNCSHKGCTFDHSKLKTNHEDRYPCQEHVKTCKLAEEIEDNEDIKSDTEDFVSLNDTDDRQRRADSGMDKSINDSIATTTSTSGFVEIESSQKENSKEENIDISFNSTNNADDEAEEEDNIPSLALDSDDEEEWDKCSTSAKDASNNSNRLTNSAENDDGNSFEIIKAQHEEGDKCLQENEERSLYKNLSEKIEAVSDNAGKILFRSYQFLALITKMYEEDLSTSA